MSDSPSLASAAVTQAIQLTPRDELSGSDTITTTAIVPQASVTTAVAAKFRKDGVAVLPSTATGGRQASSKTLNKVKIETVSLLVDTLQL